MNRFALQLDIVWEDKQANFRKAEALLERAAPPPGSLVVFPEMWATGFSFNLAATSQSAAGEDEQILAELARKHRVYVTGGLVSTGPGTQGRNEAVAFSPEGALLARYAKIHPFSLGGEAQCHECGGEIVTFPWAGFVVAPF